MNGSSRSKSRIFGIFVLVSTEKNEDSVVLRPISLVLSGRDD